MRIIIAGGGEIGYQLARQLATTRDIVVIEEDPEIAGRFDRLDLQVIRGNPTHPEKLRNAQLAESDTFIACSESDEQNIIACLAAKRGGGSQTFCFVSKEDYYRSLASQDGEEPMLAIDRVIWPQHMLAEEIARIVLVPTAIDVETFASGRIWLIEYRLEEESRFLGKPLADLHLPRGVLAVAVMSDEDFYVPSGRTKLRQGDKVVFMGKQRALRKLERRFISENPRKVRDVTVIGGGTVGLALAKRLLQGEDLRVKIIEQSAALSYLYEKIRAIVEEARVRTYRAVNTEMVRAYWLIGQAIVEQEQKGRHRADYGERLIESLSAQLSEEFGRGFDKSNLWHMRTCVTRLLKYLIQSPYLVREHFHSDLLASC